eukprot:scaffold27211_cov63-Phaeocystis_antarctica.AAC.6
MARRMNDLSSSASGGGALRSVALRGSISTEKSRTPPAAGRRAAARDRGHSDELIDVKEGHPAAQVAVRRSGVPYRQVLRCKDHLTLLRLARVIPAPSEHVRGWWTEGGDVGQRD